MCEPRWQKRCRIVGEEHLSAALASGRPVILITLHYGALLEMYHWMRGRGLPLVGMTVSHLDTSDLVRERLAFLADRANGLSGLPRVFGTSMEDLVNIQQFLKTPGRALAMAIDGGRGYHPATVQFDGITVDVQLGVFTIATVTNAVVIPFLAWSGPAMTCEIHLRQPVPDELVTYRVRRPAAADHVVRELMPLVRERPEFADGYHLLK
jgi:lauroyl/myristoyl acyltransferase